MIGTPSQELLAALGFDGSGNLYWIGSTSGTLGPMAKPGGSDIYIAKFTPAGVLAWIRMLGTGVFDSPGDGVVDGAGNVYIVGNTNGEHPGETAAGGGDVFVCKYDTNGTRLWLDQFGSAAQDFGFGIDVDQAGNVFIVGKASGNLPGQTEYSTGGHFVSKYDSDGAQQWIQQTGNSTSRAMRVSIHGADMFIGGTTSIGLDANPTVAGTALFVARYDTAGNKVWLRQFGGTSSNTLAGVFAAADGVFLTGETREMLEGQPLNATSDAWLLKYNYEGDQQWSRTTGSVRAGSGRGVIVTPSGVYLTGTRTRAGSSFDPTMLLAKWSHDGGPLWTRELGTTELALGTALAFEAGALWVGGSFSEPIAGTPYSGGIDAVAFRYDEDGNHR